MEGSLCNWKNESMLTLDEIEINEMKTYSETTVQAATNQAILF